MYVLTSCDINQESMEDADWQNGLFTGAFLDMFDPAAALGPLVNNQGEITLHAMQFYIGQRMQTRISEKPPNLWRPQAKSQTLRAREMSIFRCSK